MIAKTDHTFVLDPDAAVSPWMQLRQWLIKRIEEGYYAPGEKMPTIRALGSEVSMNNNTVSKAYTSMVHDGYLSSRRGSGIFVNDLTLPKKDERSKTINFVLESYINSCRDLGLSLEDVEKVMQMRLRALEIKEKRVAHDET